MMLLLTNEPLWILMALFFDFFFQFKERDVDISSNGFGLFGLLLTYYSYRSVAVKKSLTFLIVFVLKNICVLKLVCLLLNNVEYFKNGFL